MTEYFASDFEHPISEDELRSSDREIQLDVMETWFRQRFEDPAENMPYESAEGGYQWIWGGPYDAREVLENEFSGIVPDVVIDELVDKLEGECPEWAPTSSYDDLVIDIAQNTEYHQNFVKAILDIEQLIETKVGDAVASCFWRLLYVNVITSLETYLSDAFINTVMNRPLLIRQFIESTPEFQVQKVPLSEVFKALEEIEKKVRTYLIELVWHHIERVKPMYHATLGIEFPADLKAIFQAIRNRHDLVHRNGKTKEGQEIQITPKDVSDLISLVKTFVQHIDSQLTEVRSNIQSNTDTPPISGEPVN